MSLREKMEMQKKAQKVERTEKESKAAEEEKSSEKQNVMDTAERLGTEREAIARAIAGVRGGIEKSNGQVGSLRAARQELRSIHEDSKDEEAGEALVPKPAQLLKDEEYAQEQEVKAYEDSKESLRESFGETRNATEAAQELLAAHGVASENMSSKDALAALEQLATEKNTEVSSFVETNREFLESERERLASEETVTNEYLEKEFGGYRFGDQRVSVNKYLNILKQNAQSQHSSAEHAFEDRERLSDFMAYALRAPALVEQASKILAKTGSLRDFPSDFSKRDEIGKEMDSLKDSLEEKQKEKRSIGLEKDGFLGRNKKSKESRIAELDAEIKNLEEKRQNARERHSKAHQEAVEKIDTFKKRIEDGGYHVRATLEEAGKGKQSISEALKEQMGKLEKGAAQSRETAREWEGKVADGETKQARLAEIRDEKRRVETILNMK